MEGQVARMIFGKKDKELMSSNEVWQLNTVNSKAWSLQLATSYTSVSVDAVTPLIQANVLGICTFANCLIQPRQEIETRWADVRDISCLNGVDSVRKNFFLFFFYPAFSPSVFGTFIDTSRKQNRIRVRKQEIQ